MPDTTLPQRYVSMNLGGFYTWDVKQNLFWADERFADIMGLMRDDLDRGLPAERMISLIHEDDRPFVVDAINASVLSGEPFEMVYRVLRDNMYVKIIEFGKCFRYIDGVASLFTGIVFDSCPYSEPGRASNVNLPVGQIRR